MNNMNNKINEKKNMRKFNTFYFVNRIFHVNNTNGLDISSEDIVQKIFLNSDECYEYLITQIPDLKDVLCDYTNKTCFISKINYLRAKLSEINNYFPDNIIFKYDFFDNDSSYSARKLFYKKLVFETNNKGSVQIDVSTKAVVNKDCVIKNYQNLYGIDIVSLNYDPNKINN